MMSMPLQARSSSERLTSIISNSRVLIASAVLNLAAAVIYFTVPGDSDYLNTEMTNKVAKYSVVATVYFGIFGAQVFYLRHQSEFYPFKTAQSALFFSMTIILLVAMVFYGAYINGRYEPSKEKK